MTPPLYDENRLGPCETCVESSSDYCTTCGFDQTSCICQPKARKDDMKDWPAPLKRNAACCELAAAIFKARAEVYGGNPDMTTAPAHVRDRFIEHADNIIEALKPEPEPAHVAPFAAVREKGSLFDFAASLARKQVPATVLSVDDIERSR